MTAAISSCVVLKMIRTSDSKMLQNQTFVQMPPVKWRVVSKGSCLHNTTKLQNHHIWWRANKSLMFRLCNAYFIREGKNNWNHSIARKKVWNNKPKNISQLVLCCTCSDINDSLKFFQPVSYRLVTKHLFLPTCFSCLLLCIFWFSGVLLWALCPNAWTPFMVDQHLSLLQPSHFVLSRSKF